MVQFSKDLLASPDGRRTLNNVREAQFAHRFN
jgi:hypothetical protein